MAGIQRTTGCLISAKCLHLVSPLLLMLLAAERPTVSETARVLELADTAAVLGMACSDANADLISESR